MIAETDPLAGAACLCCLPRRGFMRGLAGLGAAAVAASSIPARSEPSGYTGLVIDCHGHYTTEPPAMLAWRKRQIDAINDPAQSPSPSDLKVSDDEVRASVAGRQLKLQSTISATPGPASTGQSSRMT